MRRTTLATLVALAAGTMNILPWGGPTIRAATALGEENVASFFMPDLPAVIAGLVAVFVIAFFLGKAEKSRLANTEGGALATYVEPELSEAEKAVEREIDDVGVARGGNDTKSLMDDGVLLD